MDKYEIWGRKELGKGKRRKLAYNIPTQDEAKSLRKRLMAVGYADWVLCHTQTSYAPDLEIGKARNRPQRGSN